MIQGAVKHLNYGIHGLAVTSEWKYIYSKQNV